MKVISGDLSAVESSASQVFASEIADADNVIKAIDTFMGSIGPGTKLTGEAYNEIKNQLASYKSVMEKRKNLASSMQSSITAATSSMSGYMAGYSELDDAELPELETSIKNAESNITSLSSQLSNTKLTTAEKGSINGSINYWQDELKKLTKKKEKLEGLAGADSSAYSSLAGAITDLSALGTGSSFSA